MSLSNDIFCYRWLRSKWQDIMYVLFPPWNNLCFDCVYWRFWKTYSDFSSTREHTRELYFVHNVYKRQIPTWFTGVLLSGPVSENQGANILILILQSPRKPGRLQYWNFWSSDSDNKWRHSQPRTSWERHLRGSFCEHTGQQTHISYLMCFSQLQSLRMHSRMSLTCQWIARLVARLE